MTRQQLRQWMLTWSWAQQPQRPLLNRGMRSDDAAAALCKQQRAACVYVAVAVEHAKSNVM